MDKRKANYDTCYCTSEDCQKDCWRKVDNWIFEEGERYCFMSSCSNYEKPVNKD